MNKPEHERNTDKAKLETYTNPFPFSTESIKDGFARKPYQHVTLILFIIGLPLAGYVIARVPGMLLGLALGVVLTIALPFLRGYK
jgi:cytochrome b561